MKINGESYRSSEVRTISWVYDTTQDGQGVPVGSETIDQSIYGDYSKTHIDGPILRMQRSVTLFTFVPVQTSLTVPHDLMLSTKDPWPTTLQGPLDNTSCTTVKPQYMVDRPLAYACNTLNFASYEGCGHKYNLTLNISAYVPTYSDSHDRRKREEIV